MTTGTEFDAIYRKYAKYPDRFELWCGLDLTGYDQPGFGAATIKELERCHQTGARGVGELHDKGKGLSSGGSKTVGMHPDDGRVTPLFEKCAELRMPVSLHVADPIWMYQPMDETNDGLMNAYEWRLDNQPDIVKLPALIDKILQPLEDEWVSGRHGGEVVERAKALRTAILPGLPDDRSAAALGNLFGGVRGGSGTNFRRQR